MAAEEEVSAAAEALVVPVTGALLVSVRNSVTDRLALQWVGGRDLPTAEAHLREVMERFGDRLYRLQDRVGDAVAASTEIPINNTSGHAQNFKFSPAERLRGIVRRNRAEFISQVTGEQVRVLTDAMRTAVSDFTNLPATPPPGAEKQIASDIRNSFYMDKRQVLHHRNFRNALMGIDRFGNRTPNGEPSLAYKRYTLRDTSQDSVIDAAIRDGKPLNSTEINRASKGYEARAIDSRAMRISRTETTRTVNIARLESWRQWAAQEGESLRNVQRTWITNIDGKERDAHKSLNGQVRGLNSTFKNNLGELLYPGDRQRGTPANTIQCRCAVRTTVKGRSEKQQSELTREIEQLASFRRVVKRPVRR